MNPFALPTVILAVFLYAITASRLRWTGGHNRRLALSIVALAVSIPGILYDAFYTHAFDRAAWFYQLRSIPSSEFLAAGMGFGAAVLLLALGRGGLKSPLGAALGAVLVFATAAPYLKPIIAPLNLSTLNNRSSGSICLQTSMSTCGPACAVTLLRNAGFSVTEAQLARECYTSRTGTENWYMARALRRRGLSVNYVLLDSRPASLPFPSIAGLGFGRAGHFVTVLGRTRDGYLIGDPLSGPRDVPFRDLRRYPFSGFFMVTSS